MKNSKHSYIRALTEGGILIALAEILSLIPLWKFPWGGSIDLGMLPVILFCIRWGFGPGMVAATAHALLQLLLGNKGEFIGWQSIIGDYMVAYMVLGVAGLFKGKMIPATLISCGLRFMVHYVVGATVWAEYMPEALFGMTMTTPWFYSLLYNAPYMIGSIAIVLVLSALLEKPMGKYFRGEDLLR